MKPTRTCKNCGEAIFDTGNYAYKLRRSKRIPRKALKALKSSDTSSLGESHSKFGNFLLQRTQPKNVVEITCGNCEFVHKMNTSKPLRFHKDYHPSGDVARTPVSEVEGQTSKRRKNKRPKELNAGLILSPGASLSTSVVITSTIASPIATSTPKPALKVNSQQNNKNKQKTLESLRKGLLKSKAQTQGASLKDFLSSM